MVTRKRKQEIVAELTETLSKANCMYFLDFAGMTVLDAYNFRNLLREKSLDYKVAKNTLIIRALNELEGVDIPEDIFVGQTGIAIGYDDPVAPAKVIKEFSDKGDKPKFKGAYLEGQVYKGAEQLKVLASLPTKKDMYASIVGSLSAPQSGMVGTINALMRDIASLVEEVAKSKAA